MPRDKISASELERARTWVPEIVKALLPADTRWPQEGNELRPSGTGGLSINVATGEWYVHSTAQGGWSPIRLIMLLKSYSRPEAVEWLLAWLHSHPGTGSVTNVDDEEIIVERTELAAERLGRAVPAAGTRTETYCRRRGITKPPPENLLRHLANARPGEDAAIGLLTVNGRVVGFQETYIDAEGNKSTALPYRRRYVLEKAPYAVFEIPAADPTGTLTDLVADTVIVEGLEDTLSIHELGRSWRIEGLPGIGTLRYR